MTDNIYIYIYIQYIFIYTFIYLYLSYYSILYFVIYLLAMAYNALRICDCKLQSRHPENICDTQHV
jgi:hypothetical protein